MTNSNDKTAVRLRLPTHILEDIAKAHPDKSFTQVVYELLKADLTDDKQWPPRLRTK